MQISHSRARQLIQFNADQALSQQDREILQAHLKSCTDCQQYTAGVREMESLLLPIMRRHWSLAPAPLSLDSLRVGKSRIPTGNSLLATRTALIGLVCMVFLFSIWQVTVSNVSAPGSFTAAVPPIPTPSTHFTLTNTAQSCGQQSYTVREGDTLEMISGQFASSKDEIMAANDLKSEELRTGTILWIPVCTFTPTGTANVSTITYTPSMRPTTSTPGG